MSYSAMRGLASEYALRWPQLANVPFFYQLVMEPSGRR